jgi:hypothetical protein
MVYYTMRGRETSSVARGSETEAEAVIAVDA